MKVFPVGWKVKLSNSSKEPGWLLLVGLEKRVMRHGLAAPLGLNHKPNKWCGGGGGRDQQQTEESAHDNVEMVKGFQNL